MQQYPNGAKAMLRASVGVCACPPLPPDNILFQAGALQVVEGKWGWKVGRGKEREETEQGSRGIH